LDLYTIRSKLNIGVPLTELNLRVTYYARVSTEHQEQKKSLKNQIDHFYEYISQNKNWTYVEGYVDEGISGTSDIKRDNFMKMIEDARLGKFDLIITKEISRFSRNTLDSIKYTRLLLSYGVFVLFVNDNINTALPDSELRLTIMASMAQDEIRRLSERVKFGMNRAILRGEILGNNKLYGYTKDKNTGSLNIVEKEAKVVRKIYKLYTIDKLSLSRIAKLLNKENIKTKAGNKWSTTTISRIIKNPKYKGYYCGKKTEIVDYITKKVKYINKEDWIIYKDNKKIPQIIEESLWNNANYRLNIKTKKNNKVTTQKYLYSGKIICHNDNTYFNRRIFRKHNKDATWICSTYLKQGKSFCNTPNIRESELTTILKDLILRLNINLTDILSFLIQIYKKENIPNNLVLKRKLIKEKKLIYSKKEKLLDLTLNGNISNKEFSIKNNLYKEKITILEKQLLNIEETNINYIEIENYLKEKINSKQVLEKVISIILDKIVALKENNTIKLKVYINYPIKDFKSLEKNYCFKRGEDTKCTKRYNVYYKIFCYNKINI